MDKINTLMDKIDSITNISEKIEYIKELTTLIENEKKIYTDYINNIENTKVILHKKYSKFDINELENMFNNEDNINNMIKIYQTLCYKINLISNELFNIDNFESSSDSE